MQSTKRGSLLFGLFLSLTFSALNSAKAQVPESDKCFSAVDVAELAQNFKQLQPFLQGEQPVCQSQVGVKWAKVIESLLDLKNIELDPERDYKTKDDFSFKAIAGNQWWEYFIQRADSFVLEGSSCRPGTVAYVHPFLMGVVNLCAPYYESGRISRAEVLLHEVRHFEGFGHVTCTRGPDKGVRGACDTELQLKGSYAVSMQANVTLGLRGKNFDEGERALGRASALYLLQARFNKETDVKIKQSLYLENAAGEVYEWFPKGDQQPVLITKLKQPAKIYTASMEAIIYPFDTKLPAYRLADDFTVATPRLGMYADVYNKKNEEERKSFKVHAYNTNGGFLTDTGYSAICGQEIVELKKEEFLEPIATVLTLESIDQNLVDYIVGVSGQLYTLDCSPLGKTSLKAQGLYVPRELHRSAIVDGQRYGLTAAGDLFELEKSGTQFNLVNQINFSEEGEKWIEMAIRTMPYLFDEAKTKQDQFMVGLAGEESL